VEEAKESLYSRVPTSGRSTGVSLGNSVGPGVGVSVGGNQITVGVAVCVGAGVSVGKSGKSCRGRQAVSKRVIKMIGMCFIG